MPVSQLSVVENEWVFICDRELVSFGFGNDSSLTYECRCTVVSIFFRGVVSEKLWPHEGLGAKDISVWHCCSFSSSAGN